MRVPRAWRRRPQRRGVRSGRAWNPPGRSHILIDIKRQSRRPHQSILPEVGCALSLASDAVPSVRVRTRMDEQHLLESPMAISIEALWTMPVAELLAAYYDA